MEDGDEEEEGNAEFQLQFQTYTLLCDVLALGLGEEPLVLRDLRLEEGFDQASGYDRLIECTVRGPVIVQYTPSSTPLPQLQLPFPPESEIPYELEVDDITFPEKFRSEIIRCAEASDDFSPTLRVKLLVDRDYHSSEDFSEDDESNDEQQGAGPAPVIQQAADFADRDPDPEQEMQSVTNEGKETEGKGYRKGNQMVDFMPVEHGDGRAVVRVFDGECGLISRLHPLGSELTLVSATMDNTQFVQNCRCGNCTFRSFLAGRRACCARPGRRQLT